MFNKIKKALLVIFVTCLIWVWADMSEDEELSGQMVTITASQANRSLWVRLENKPEIQVEFDLSGPRTKINEFSRKIEDGGHLRVTFDAEREGMGSEGVHTVDNLRRFLQDQIRKEGLVVVSCVPEKLNVQVLKLVEKPLVVECIDEESGAPIANVKITPKTVNMFAPLDKSTAIVKLSSAEKKQARQDFVVKEPYINLGGRLRYAEESVRIGLPEVGEDLQLATIRGTLGYIVSENWTGEYKVEWVKAPDIGSIPILATLEAKIAYVAQDFEVLLQIKDDDIKLPEITREVIYNWPEKFARDDKIRLNGDPAEATFKLVLVKPAEGGIE